MLPSRNFMACNNWHVIARWGRCRAAPFMGQAIFFYAIFLGNFDQNFGSHEFSSFSLFSFILCQTRNQSLIHWFLREMKRGWKWALKTNLQINWEMKFRSVYFEIRWQFGMWLFCLCHHFPNNYLTSLKRYDVRDFYLICLMWLYTRDIIGMIVFDISYR